MKRVILGVTPNKHRGDGRPNPPAPIPLVEQESYLEVYGVYRGVAQSGSASALGAEGRWFKSSLPYHFRG